MAKAIRNIFNLETLSLTECNDGFYLYDKVMSQNIVMRAKTEQDACIDALLFYQKTYSESKSAYKKLDNKVQSFLTQFDKEDF